MITEIRSLWMIGAWTLVLFSGCTTFNRHGNWPQPTSLAPDRELLFQPCSVRPGSLALMQGELSYALGCEARDSANPASADHFFLAAKSAWEEIEANIPGVQDRDWRAIQLYHSALQSLLEEGQRYHRFDPAHGLQIQTEAGQIQIPIHYHGFVQDLNEITGIIPVGDYSTNELNHLFRRAGLGVAAVVVREKKTEATFQRSRSSFAATCIMRPVGNERGKQSFVIELYDPVRQSSIMIRDAQVNLTRDTSAPIAMALNSTPRNYLQAFLAPSKTNPEEAGLFMLEPYQPGKIPIIFIHGLLSDRLTWANAVNEFLARPEFVERFQVWGFEYPTGEPFLKSAALLRRQLKELCDRNDPMRTDTSLRQIVLVGHSMGGLISSAQITFSDVYLWNSIACVPFDEIVCGDVERSRLSEAFFFDPSPNVSRVVFIGTPHRGSALAGRMIGKIGSLLVEEPDSMKEAHRKLLHDNPGAFFEEFSRRVPTSIDLLEPQSRLLASLRTLPRNKHVQVHSIIGVGTWMPSDGDSDGVVPVSSARSLNAVSEEFVVERHSKLTTNDKVIEELLAILREHERSVSNDAIYGSATFEENKF